LKKPCPITTEVKEGKDPKTKTYFYPMIKDNSVKGSNELGNFKVQTVSVVMGSHVVGCSILFEEIQSLQFKAEQKTSST
jgi:hypothetical protein